MSDINIEILDGALGFLPSSGDELHAVIGCCSLGDQGVFTYSRKPDAMVAARGYGPAVQAAAFNARLTGLPLLLARVDATTDGQVAQWDNAINIVSSTNATPIVVTTAPHNRLDGEIVTIADHLLNTGANGTFKIHVLDATTFSLLGSVGVAIGGATGTISPHGITAPTLDEDSTSFPSIADDTDPPLDTYRIRWKWIKGGTRGTAGATAQYSADGGATWSHVFPIGTATSYEIANTNITIEFGAGDWTAGDEYRIQTTEPKWGIDDVVIVLEALRALKRKFRLVQLVGDMTASDVTTLATVLEEYATKYLFTGLLGNARDIDSSDADEDDWIDSLVADFDAVDSNRISVTGGHYRVTSAIDSRKYRRPLSWAAAARIMSRPIQEHAGRVRTGSLKGIDIPSGEEIARLALDSDVYHDSDDKPGLREARFMTCKTRIGRKGLYIDKPAMLAQSTSDFQDWHHRSVIDKACDITYEVLVDELNEDIDLDPDTGFITEKAAQAIENRLKSAFRDGLLAKGAASAVTAQIDRTVNIISTKRLKASVRVLPKGYVEGIDVDVAYTNPALQLAA